MVKVGQDSSMTGGHEHKSTALNDESKTSIDVGISHAMCMLQAALEFMPIRVYIKAICRLANGEVLPLPCERSALCVFTIFSMFQGGEELVGANGEDTWC